jgi:hypothetical protein
MREFADKLEAKSYHVRLNDRNKIILVGYTISYSHLKKGIKL